LEQLHKACPFAPAFHRILLDQTVGLLARNSLLYKGEHDTLGIVESIALIDIRLHSLRIDTEVPQYAGQPVEHIINKDGAVGNYDSFDRGVGYVPFMPEGDIFHRSNSIRADQPGQP